MSKTRILNTIGIALSVIGIVCYGIYLGRGAKDLLFFALGSVCTCLAITMNRVARREEMKADATVLHYDMLVDEGNDPVHDPEPLKAYMDGWDGQDFIDKMELDGTESVLEIGVGTGRLAIRVAPLSSRFCGIDISPKTVERAKENLAGTDAELICGDFMTYDFSTKFDVIYSSLTLMHIADKAGAVKKAASLLKDGGRFLLSTDKNQSNVIDMDTRKITVYPDDPEDISACISAAGLTLTEKYETEQAYIFVCDK